MQYGTLHYYPVNERYLQYVSRDGDTILFFLGMRVHHARSSGTYTHTLATPPHFIPYYEYSTRPYHYDHTSLLDLTTVRMIRLKCSHLREYITREEHSTLDTVRTHPRYSIILLPSKYFTFCLLYRMTFIMLCR
jgi:hypothetical protein